MIALLISGLLGGLVGIFLTVFWGQSRKGDDGEDGSDRGTEKVDENLIVELFYRMRKAGILCFEKVQDVPNTYVPVCRVGDTRDENLEESMIDMLGTLSDASFEAILKKEKSDA